MFLDLIFVCLTVWDWCFGQRSGRGLLLLLVKRRGMFALARLDQFDRVTEAVVDVPDASACAEQGATAHHVGVFADNERGPCGSGAKGCKVLVQRSPRCLWRGS